MNGSGHENKSPKGKQAKNAPSMTESAGEAATALCERIAALPVNSWRDELDRERERILAKESKGEIDSGEAERQREVVDYAEGLLKARRYALQRDGEIVPWHIAEGSSEYFTPFIHGCAEDMERVWQDAETPREERLKRLREIREAHAAQVPELMSQWLNSVLEDSRAAAKAETPQSVKLIAEQEPLASKARSAHKCRVKIGKTHHRQKDRNADGKTVDDFRERFIEAYSTSNVLKSDGTKSMNYVAGIVAGESGFTIDQIRMAAKRGHWIG